MTTLDLADAYMAAGQPDKAIPLARAFLADDRGARRLGCRPRFTRPFRRATKLLESASARAARTRDQRAGCGSDGRAERLKSVSPKAGWLRNYRHRDARTVSRESADHLGLAGRAECWF